MARLEMTSLAFMLDWVPEPVCQTTRGKWSRSLRSATSLAACWMASPILGSVCSQKKGQVSFLRIASIALPELAPEGIGRVLHTKTVAHVDGGGSALEDTEGLDNGRRHAVLGLVDLEVAQGALGLGAPVLVVLDLDLAKGIGLDSGVLGHGGRAGEVAGRGLGGRERVGDGGDLGGGAGGI